MTVITATTRTSISKPENQNAGWLGLYKLGSATALLAILVALTDIFLTFLPAGAEPPGTMTAVDWFHLFQDNWFLGLRNLGLLPNILTLILLIPVYLALYVVHRQANPAYAMLAMIISLIGAVVYLANNAAFPMWALSAKYATATAEAQRNLLAAAGEAILAHGEDFTPGSFIGILFQDIAVVLISSVMLRARIFTTATACTGILGGVFLTVFTIWSTFIPAHFGIVMILAMGGGLLVACWYILTARKLFQLSLA